MKFRLRAALAHLSGSVCIALLALAVVYGLWYPAPLAVAAGVNGIFALMLGVDVVTGPVLTFAVFKKGKKALFFDLAVIAALQLTALSYGLWTIAQGRPAWLVFNADRFDLTQASDIDARYQAQAAPAFRHAPKTGPRWVASVNPADPEKRTELVLESAGGGPDLPQRVDLFVPLAKEKTAVQAQAEPLEKLKQFNSPEQVNKTLARWPQADAWLPLMARVQPMTVLIERGTGRPLAVVDLRPWS